MIFVGLTALLMLNMLIAAMSETFSSLGPLERELWIGSQFSAVLVMDRQLPRFLVNYCLKKFMVAMSMPGSNVKKRGIIIETKVPPQCDPKNF